MFIMPQSNLASSGAPSAMSSNKAEKLAVIGTVAIDAVQTPFGKRDKVFGGSAAYFSYAASFFTPVSLVAVVGKDFPDEYRAILQERKIDLSHLEVREGKTFSWQGSYESDMNSAKTLRTDLNVLLEFNPVLRFNQPPDFLFLANVDPVIQMRTIEQLERPKLKFVACDTMNFWIATKKKELLQVLKHIDCLVLNDGEARELTGECNLVKAARKIQEQGPGIVVIKKGEHGVLLFSGSKFFALPAYPLESVFDPTGAGDTFAGGMVGYLAKTGDLGFENLKRAATYGTMVASFTVEDFGLESLRRITADDLDNRLVDFKMICSF